MFSAFFAILGLMSFFFMIYNNPLLAILFIFGIVTIYLHHKEKRDTIKNSLERIRKELNDCAFKVSKEICLTRDADFSDVASSEIIIDEYNRQIAICIFYTDNLEIFSFSELLNCEVIEDGEVIYPSPDSTTYKSALTIGMDTTPKKVLIHNLSIRLETSKPDICEILIPIINRPTKLADNAYRRARSTARDVYYELSKIIRIHSYENQHDYNQ